MKEKQVFLLEVGFMLSAYIYSINNYYRVAMFFSILNILLGLYYWEDEFFDRNLILIRIIYGIFAYGLIFYFGLENLFKGISFVTLVNTLIFTSIRPYYYKNIFSAFMGTIVLILVLPRPFVLLGRLNLLILVGLIFCPLFIKVKYDIILKNKEPRYDAIFNKFIHTK